MLAIYLFAAALGGGLLAFSLLGGHDGSADDPGHGDNPFDFLSIRTLTYFLFVFGGVGAVLTWSWRSAASPLILLLATASGLVIGALVAATFGYLRRTDSGAHDGEESFVGLTARVTLPIANGGIGKILVRRGDRTFELMARPHDQEAAAAAADWTSVIVVEMNRGTAMIAPLDDPALIESSTP
jgi:membrane protein implicated in regulation of membrane protease activity